MYFRIWKPFSSQSSLTNLCFYLFNSKQMATGARPCLSTGHRKQQDFPLWILPPWTLAAGIKSSASTSGPCASCKGVSREGKCRGESRDCWTDSWCDQPRCTYEYRGLLWPCGEIFIVPFDPVQDGKDLFWNLHEKLVLKKKKKIRIIPLSSCVCLTSSFVHFRGPKILPFNFAKEHRSFKLLLWLLFVSPERFHWNYDVCPTTTNFF